MAGPLKLRAEDGDDLTAVSALVQDAVLKVGDIAYLPKSRRFALVLNRFRWEAGRTGGRGERIRTGLHIDYVLKAEATRIRQDAKDAVLCLLALVWKPYAEGGGELELSFSGGGAIRLHVETLEAGLDDLTDAWPARGRPGHAIDETPAP